GEIVPDVLAIDGAVAARPGADEIRSERDDALHEQRAPVVADEVDGLADALDLRRQPVDVRFLGGVEADRNRTAEAGQRGREHVASREVRAQLVPEPVGIGHAVHENRGHAAGWRTAGTCFNRAALSPARSGALVSQTW